jgi:drug/metabolite transporter (DMT)-like permease
MIPVTLIAALFVWQTPSLLEVGWLFAIAAFAVLGHLALVQAFKEAEVSTVLPFDFTKLVWATVFGYLIFVEIPDVWTWVGGILISAATTYMAYRETRAGSSSG